MKQKTLEEVAVNCWAEGAWDNRDDFTDGFIEGAKWQQERSYSEEEVLELILKSKIETSNLYYEDMKEWFEQFKKK